MSAMRRIADWLLLAIALLAGAWLRLRKLDATSLWLDEIIDYDIATRFAAHPTWRWWNVSKEHGPLFFVSELAGRVTHSIELAARTPPAILGIAAIVLGWAFVRRQFPFGTAAVFALLLAISPLHVYYSGEARPYSLLMLLAIALLALLLRRGSPGLMAVTLLAAALTSATAAPLIMSVLIIAALIYLFDREHRRFATHTMVAAGLCLLAIPLLYVGNSDPTAVTAPAVSLTRLVQSFSMSALDSTAPRAAGYLVALAAIIGSVVAIRRDRISGTIITGMAVLPIVIAIVALWTMSHWYSVRYVAAALPAYLLLAAIGIVASARPVLAIVIAAAIAREAWPAASAEPLQRLDWRVVATTIRQHAHDDDLVIAMNAWSYVSLEFYLRGQRLRMISALESTAGATHLVAMNTPAWIVSAGETRGMTREWTCRYPIVLALPLESFRLHYAPSFGHLLLNRATDADRRAFATRFAAPLTLGLGPESDLFLTHGFGDAEGTNGDYARWVVGTSASLIVPRGQRITIRALPLLRRDAPPQQMTVTLNGTPLAQLAMANEWRDYTIDVPPSLRRDVNELTLTFGWSAVPGGNDARSLSAMLDHVAIGAVTAPLPKELTALTHINSAGFLREHPVERHQRESFVARDRAALTALLTRLGFDPLTTMPALDRGDVRLDELANVIACESECRGDAEFIAVAYAVLVDRRVEGTAAQYFLAQLRRGVPRSEIIRKIVASGAMRAKLHAVAD
ncbi:MAG: rane protein-like protein [Acidobacteria bacterium]|nr:rane protein-like protein [Acidobacteriota bacterium]